MQLMIATGNPGKLDEIKAIINTHCKLNLHVRAISELNIPEPDEPHSTFMQNAQHKAKYYAQKSGIPTLSEDSGLCIAALDGFPGVRSKEFVDECGGIEKAFAFLEQKLQHANNMQATFICAATIYLPDLDQFISFEAMDEGQISFPARGTQCFGFDPIYMPDGYTNTMAELGPSIKNQIGHRGKAIRGLLHNLQEYIHNS